MDGKTNTTVAVVSRLALDKHQMLGVEFVLSFGKWKESVLPHVRGSSFGLIQGSFQTECKA